MKKILALISVLALAACIGPQSSGTDSGTGTGTSTTVPPPPLTTATNPQTTPPPPPTGTMPPVTTPPPPPPPTTTGTVPPPPPPPVIPPKPAPAPPPTVTAGNCVNAKCGDLGTKTYLTDIHTLSPSATNLPSRLLFFPSGDAKSGAVFDVILLRRAPKAYYPAGYTMASVYYWRTCPTTSNGQTETCSGSGTDWGGLCAHRFAGIVERDAPQVWNTVNGWVLKQAHLMYGVAPVDAAVNAWLAKYGQLLPKPCSKLPCP